MPDYIPPADAEFAAWGDHFVDYVTTNFAALGLLLSDTTAVSNAHGIWQTAFPDHVAAVAAADAAKEAKDLARRNDEAAVRALVNRLQASAAVSNAERAAMGITVRDTTRTPAPPPTTRPVGTVESGERLRHTVRFTDEATPTRRAKPAGVQGCEIWVAVKAAGAAGPADAGELDFLALDGATPYVSEYPGADAGKVAWYWLRWVSTRGAKGPWSEPVSATIGG